jgi:hypothetical protein
MANKDKVRSDKTSDLAQIDTRLGPDPKPVRDETTAEVTYIPGDGDPHRVTWGGLIPTVVLLTQAISMPMRKEHVLASRKPTTTAASRSGSFSSGTRGRPAICNIRWGQAPAQRRYEVQARQNRHVIPEIVGIHLESEPAPNGANWRGRQTRPFRLATGTSVS